ISVISDRGLSTVMSGVGRLGLVLLLVPWYVVWSARAGGSGRRGSWELLLDSTGAVAMHMALTYCNTVVMFDQVSAGPSGLRMPGCGPDDDGKRSCWVHSVEYDIAANAVRPLALKTDPWCSSGAFLSDGVFAQTGGYGDGVRRVRYFDPSDPLPRWSESSELLVDKRWYSSDHVLPEKDRVIVVGGLNVFTYEFIPKTAPKEGAFELPFLRQTRDKKESGDNLYPFIHLSSDGNLFIFANHDSILFDYNRNQVVKTFPTMPGGGPRNYPSTGSSVMLPLDFSDGFLKVEVMICGGAATGAYRAWRRGKFYRALSSCGRMVITDDEPNWAMEDMPGPRLMNDMLLLPTGDVLLINGATHGCAGWRRAKNPSYAPYLYKPNNEAGERFSLLNPSSIARMYHSTAIVLPDGRILVGGSNPYKNYTFGVPYPTELRLEAFTPYYMDTFFDSRRPSNLSVQCGEGRDRIGYGEKFIVRFELGRKPGKLEFVVYAPPFATHSQSMNQRMLKLGCSGLVRETNGAVHAVLKAPPSSTVAPAGFYLLSVVNGGIPSKFEWLRFAHE
ncbi:unnamed protein product, partial [Musa hybrid cultivar]